MSLEERKRLQKEFQESLSNLLAKIEENLGSLSAQNMLVSSLDAMLTKERKLKKNNLTRFADEPELKSWLVKHFSDDFHLYPEVKGINELTGKTVYIDYIAYPREHVIEAGFIQQPFGIEVKHIDQELGFIKKTSRVLWQAASYNQCQFTLQNKYKKRVFRLPFSLVFTNLSFDDEFDQIKQFDGNLINDQTAWRGMKHLANHANVGELKVRGNITKAKQWFMHFAGGTYFRGGKDNTGNKSYDLVDRNLVTKVRIGNF